MDDMEVDETDNSTQENLADVICHRSRVQMEYPGEKSRVYIIYISDI